MCITQLSQGSHDIGPIAPREGHLWFTRHKKTMPGVSLDHSPHIPFLAHSILAQRVRLTNLRRVFNTQEGTYFITVECIGPFSSNRLSWPSPETVHSSPHTQHPCSVPGTSYRPFLGCAHRMKALLHGCLTSGIWN